MFILQNKILEAFRKKNYSQVIKLQNALIKSFAARALAVRKVTSNKSKNNYGIDKIILKTNSEKLKAIKDVKNLSNYKAKPVRTIFITKDNGKLRKIGIPTVYDKIVQTLFHYALDPIAEETSCIRSYGFRPHRSLHDNAVYLKLVLGSYTATRRYV